MFIEHDSIPQNNSYSSVDIYIQGGSKGHVQTAGVDVSGHEEQELHRNQQSETPS